MAALMRLAGMGDMSSDDEMDERTTNALMRMTGKRGASRSPSVSPDMYKPATAELEAEEDYKDMPFCDFDFDYESESEEEEEEEEPPKSKAGNQNASTGCR